MKRWLIVDGYGHYVAKHSERIRVKKEGAIIEEIPLIHLEAIHISSRGVSISSDVIEICTERGIDIFFTSGDGQIYGRLASPTLIGTVKTRREQLMALMDSRGLEIGRAVASAKLGNQRNLIQYFARYRKVTDKGLYELMTDRVKAIDALKGELIQLTGSGVEGLREKILNIEGRAAHFYWETMKSLIGGDWEGRVGRGAKDPINSALNYGYGILYGQVEKAIVMAGLDPFAGFVHTDRSGKPSLILDLIEEFRQMAIDKAVFSMIGKGTKIVVREDGLLDGGTRKGIANKVFERLDSAERYQGQRMKLKTIIMRQAQRMASFIRKDIPNYKPFVGSW